MPNTRMLEKARTACIVLTYLCLAGIFATLALLPQPAQKEEREFSSLNACLSADGQSVWAADRYDHIASSNDGGASWEWLP